MQIRPDDRALLQRIAALADAEPPKRARNVHEHMARRVGAASSAELRDKRGLPLACLRRLEARGLLQFGSISGDRQWYDTLERLADRYSISVDWLVRRIGFLVRPSPAGYTQIDGTAASGEWISAKQAVLQRLVADEPTLTRLAQKHPAIRRSATDEDRQRIGDARLRFVYDLAQLEELKRHT
jgi:hypothetical protein